MAERTVTIDLNPHLVVLGGCWLVLQTTKYKTRQTILIANL